MSQGIGVGFWERHIAIPSLCPIGILWPWPRQKNGVDQAASLVIREVGNRGYVVSRSVQARLRVGVFQGTSFKHLTVNHKMDRLGTRPEAGSSRNRARTEEAQAFVTLAQTAALYTCFTGISPRNGCGKDCQAAAVRMKLTQTAANFHQQNWPTAILFTFGVSRP